MDKGPKKRLGEMLKTSGLLDDMQLRSALAHQKQWGGRLGSILLKLNMVSEEKLVAFLARQFRMPVIDLARVEIQPAMLQLVPKNLAIQSQVLPLFKGKEEDKEYLAIAMANPGDLTALDEIRFTARLDPKPIIVSDPQLVRAIDFYYLGNGIPPYDDDAIPSSKMTMKDVVAITRDFLSATKAAAAPADSGNRPPQYMIGESPSAEDSDDNDDDESVLIFSGGEETAFSLDDQPVEEEDLPVPVPQDSAASMDSERILRALIEVLDKKGIVSKAEIKRFLKTIP